MKVLLVVTDLDLGGAETQVVTLACGLAARGHDVRVISLIDPVALTDQLDEASVPWLSLGMRRGSADPRGIVRLRNAILEFQPDVVHSHMVHANLLARVTRLTVRMPMLISTAHSMIEGGRLLDFGYRFTDRLANLTTNVSQSAVQAFIDRGLTSRRRINLVPNGLDFSLFEEARDQRKSKRQELGLDSFTWLAVGRLSVEKDYGNLLAAWKLLPEGSRLLFAGDGPDRERLQRLTSDGVTFLGRRSDIPALMAASDGFVLTSLFEGLPMVLLEAGAAGLPVVSTDVGGIPEIVTDSVTGKLVPARNPEALAHAMLWIMELTDGERRQLTDAARDNVQSRYALSSVLDRWEQIYAGNG